MTYTKAFCKAERIRTVNKYFLISLVIFLKKKKEKKKVSLIAKTKPSLYIGLQKLNISHILVSSFEKRRSAKKGKIDGKVAFLPSCIVG